MAGLAVLPEVKQICKENYVVVAEMLLIVRQKHHEKVMRTRQLPDAAQRPDSRALAASYGDVSFPRG